MKRILIASVMLALAFVPAAAQQKAPVRQSPKPATPAPAAPASASPKTERPVPFKAGETLIYDVSWSSYVTAGTATLSVKEKKPSFNSTAYYIVAEGRPTPLLSKLYSLYYKLDTLLDVYTLLPQRGSIFSQEGGRQRMKITRFDQVAHKAQFEIQTATSVKQDVVIPPYTQDALSAFYLLRVVPLKEGGKMTMPVSDSGSSYRLQITVGRKETVEAGIGSVPAWRVTPVLLDEKGTSTGRGTTVWLSDDARRLPVRLETELAVGSFVLVLRSVAAL